MVEIRLWSWVDVHYVNEWRSCETCLFAHRVANRSSCDALVQMESSRCADCCHNPDGCLRWPQHREHWAHFDPFLRLPGTLKCLILALSSKDSLLIRLFQHIKPDRNLEFSSELANGNWSVFDRLSKKKCIDWATLVFLLNWVLSLSCSTSLVLQFWLWCLNFLRL